MIISGTGHRPNKLGGYSNEILARLISLAEKELDAIKADHPLTSVISGMALGWDTALAIAAIRKGLVLHAAIPFAGQEKMWPAESQDRYNKILSKCEEVIVLSYEPYSPTLMQKRNEWMVDNSELVLALHNGSKGGTYNCIQYAKSKGVRIINLWDKWQKFMAKK